MAQDSTAAVSEAQKQAYLVVNKGGVQVGVSEAKKQAYPVVGNGGLQAVGGASREQLALHQPSRCLQTKPSVTWETPHGLADQACDLDQCDMPGHVRGLQSTTNAVCFLHLTVHDISCSSMISTHMCPGEHTM